jgi:hypothetical protein
MRFHDVSVNQSVSTKVNRSLTSYVREWNLAEVFEPAVLILILSYTSMMCTKAVDKMQVIPESYAL